MSKTMTKSETAVDAIKLLKEDHKKVKGLFDEFEDSENPKQQKKIAEEAIAELKVHAAIEEEIFYPAIREALKDKEDSLIMEEAEQEHHVVKLLIEELEGMAGFDKTYEAKFIVLAENVRHHIKEEEGEMLPEAKKAEVDMKDLGEQMMARKEELQQASNN